MHRSMILIIKEAIIFVPEFFINRIKFEAIIQKSYKSNQVNDTDRLQDDECPTIDKLYDYIYRNVILLKLMSKAFQL